MVRIAVYQCVANDWFTSVGGTDVICHVDQGDAFLSSYSHLGDTRGCVKRRCAGFSARECRSKVRG